MSGWTLVLIPRNRNVSPMVVDHPGPPPELLARHGDEDLEALELPPTVYRQVLVLPGQLAVYTVDDYATMQAGRLADGLPATPAPPGDEAARHRAVITEDEVTLRRAIRERDPDLATLERERYGRAARQPRPAAPGR